MNRRRLLIIGMLSVVVAGIISLRMYGMLRQSAGGSGAVHVQVVAAQESLQPGQKIAATHLKFVSLPARQLPEGVFHEMEPLVDQVVASPVAKNELLLSSRLASSRVTAGLPAIIPPGMRAVSVRVNEVVAVAGFVVPGTRVDVLLTGTPGPSNNPGAVTTTTVLRNVQVIAAGQQLEHDPSGKPQSVPVITLLVSPDDAQRLTLASSEGRIQLSLRNPEDIDVEAPPALRNAALYGHVRAPELRVRRSEPAPPLPRAYSVEVIRGAKRDVAEF